MASVWLLPIGRVQNNKITFVFQLRPAKIIKTRKIVRSVEAGALSYANVKDEFILRFKIALGHVINDIKTHLE